MSRWEYCILRYFSEELDETNWSNVLHHLSRNMQDYQESSIYYPSTRRGLGPGSRSYLRKNSRDYYVIFKKYFGSFTKDEITIGESFSSRMRRFAKALIQHGRNGRRLLEKNSRTYHQKRKTAARAMFQVLNRLNSDSAYSSPRLLWKNLPIESRGFIDDLTLVLKYKRYPAFWRLALASATIKVLYGLKFTGEEGPATINREFANLVFKLLQRFKQHNHSPEIKDAIEEINAALKVGHSRYKPPLQHVYNVGGRELIIQNFRFPTWLNLCRQTKWAEGDRS
jgi:hypothetical protein